MYELILPKEIGELGEKNTDTFKYVVKIKVGNRFYIGRSVGFHFLRDELKKCFIQYKHRPDGLSVEHLYFPIVKYMVASGEETATVEILFKSENGYQVMKEELNQLIANYEKKRCLNANRFPHIPAFKTSKSTSKWLTHNEWLNFKKLVNQYE